MFWFNYTICSSSSCGTPHQPLEISNLADDWPLRLLSRTIITRCSVLPPVLMYAVLEAIPVLRCCLDVNIFRREKRHSQSFIMQPPLVLVTHRSCSHVNLLRVDILYIQQATSYNCTYLDGSDCLNKPKRSIKVARSCCYLWPALFGLWNFKLLLNRSIKVRHLPEPGHIKLQFNKTWVFNIQLTVCVVNKMIRADGCNL